MDDVPAPMLLDPTSQMALGSSSFADDVCTTVTPREEVWGEGMWRETRDEREEPRTCLTGCVISGHFFPSLGLSSPTHGFENQLRAGCDM